MHSADPEQARHASDSSAPLQGLLCMPCRGAPADALDIKRATAGPVESDTGTSAVNSTLCACALNL